MATFGNESIRGLRQCREAFKALPEIAQESFADATEETAEHVRAGAVSNVPVLYGFLRDHIAKTMSRKTGIAKVGVTRGSAVTPEGKTVEPSRYAHLVEFGSIHNEASHFMLRSVEAQRTPYLERCRKAGKEVEKRTAAIGMRFV